MKDRRHPPKKGVVEQPLVIDGWKIYVWSEFRDRWEAMRKRVETLRATDPGGYRTSAEAKFFATVRDLVMKVIPAEPDARKFRQGKTMGADNKHWRRAKFMGRFRLFFRYHGASKTIIYVWLNDEKTLRKTGASTDVYTVFAGMLASKRPPTDWDDLLRACQSWSGTSA